MTYTRRVVLKTIGATTAAGCMMACGGDDGGGSGVATGTAEMCGANLCFNLSQNTELQSVGGILFFDQAPGRKIFVIRASETELRALTAICTHAGCTVGYNADADQFDCPCHGSQYDTAGAVKRGPAGLPLKNFPTTVAGDQVTIKL